MQMYCNITFGIHCLKRYIAHRAIQMPYLFPLHLLQTNASFFFGNLVSLEHSLQDTEREKKKSSIKMMKLVLIKK